MLFRLPDLWRLRLCVGKMLHCAAGHIARNAEDGPLESPPEIDWHEFEKPAFLRNQMPYVVRPIEKQNTSRQTQRRR